MIDKNFLNLYQPQRVFLVQGDEADFFSLMEDLRSDFGLVPNLNLPQFKVEHAHLVVKFALEGSGIERVMAVFFSNFSFDSAQILLKPLEEPDPLTSIVFVTPHPYMVPVTIRSRVVLIYKSLNSETPNRQITKLEALEYIKKEITKESEEDASVKRASGIDFLDKIEIQFKNDPQKLKVIYEAKDMIYKSNLPIKFVLEYVISLVL